MILSLGLIALTAGCAAGRDYAAPAALDLGLPEGYTRGGGEPLADADLASWWTRFNEPALDALVQKAIAANLDIAQGTIRLRQARESLVQARAGYLPQVSGSAGTGRNFDSDAADRNSFSVGADASWEVDLFGGIGRSVEAARADLQGAGYDLAAVRTAIIAELVTNYIQLRQSQERLRIARETLEIADDTLQITGWRIQAGLVSSLDQEQARASRASTAASIPTIETTLAGSLNRIAVLTGDAPGESTRALEEARDIPVPPLDIASGIPADTLRQRPDVRGAERTLAAATARIGVAQAALYPSLGISGNIGTSALSLGSLADTITGGLFAGLTQTLFNGGRLRSQVRSQEAAADGAFAAYKQTVLTGLEDVENALVALDAAQERLDQFVIALDASNNSAILARSQYRAGLTDFQTLLQAEQSLLSSRDGLASAKAAQAQAVVQLYSALGGGWQTMDGKPE
nr:efflux transporter outer membrane subunit [Sphingobium boeckii]